MDDVKADAKGSFRRIEVLTGPARRRRWSASEKARVVAETLIEGASISEVARRWQVCPQQVFTWRREARAGHLVLPSEASVPSGFVPILAERPAPLPVTVGEDAVGPTAKCTAKTASAPVIEIKLAGMVVRVRVGTDRALLTEVLRAVRASAE
jgi:transposase